MGSVWKSYEEISLLKVWEPFRCSQGNGMEWKIIEPWEIGDKERIEMAKEFGGKKRAQSYGSQESRIWKQAWGDLQCNDWRKNE